MNLKEQKNNQVVDSIGVVQQSKEKRNYIIGKCVNTESPRKLNNFSKIITFKHITIDEHNYVNSKDLINDLACKANKNAVLELEKEINILSHFEYIAKLTDIAISKYLILPLVLENSKHVILENLERGEYARYTISNSTEKWKDNYSGYACISYEKIEREYGNCNNETITAVKNRIKKELDDYELWQLNSVYDFKLIEIDEDKQTENLNSYTLYHSLEGQMGYELTKIDELKYVKVIESYGVHYSKDSLRAVVSDEFKYLLDSKNTYLIDKQMYKPKNINIEEITEFIKKEIPFDKMLKNCGIYETSPLAIDENNCAITIGVTYEDNLDFEEGISDYNNENHKEHYCYNIFIGEEYINIDNSIAYKNDLTPTSTVEELVREIKELVNKDCATWIFDESI